MTIKELYKYAEMNGLENCRLGIIYYDNKLNSSRYIIPKKKDLRYDDYNEILAFNLGDIDKYPSPKPFVE